MPEPWDEHQIDALTEYWGKAYTASQIATRIGKTRNAVIGKAHRLGLKARPSPIIRDVSPPPTSDHPCQFPTNKDGEEFEVCGKDAQIGSPYCPQHHRTTHQRKYNESKRDPETVPPGGYKR